MFTMMPHNCRGATPEVVASSAPRDAPDIETALSGTVRRGVYCSMQAPAWKRRTLFLLLHWACLMGRVPLLARAHNIEEVSFVNATTSVDAGEALTVEWSYSASGGTTGDLNSYTINLHYCGEDGSSCSSNSGGGSGSSCGDTYAGLCTRNGGICMDSDGSYDVEVPADTPPGIYAVMVTSLHNTTVASCSAAFNVTAPEGIAAAAAEGEPFLEVLYPADYLEGGSAFTAKWIYDDGAGDAEGTFEVNLKRCMSESGDCDDVGCGIHAAYLCEETGCYDPGTGDYDVVIPAGLEEGQYTLEVINVKDKTSGCLEFSFDVDSGDHSASTLAPLHSPLPSSAPRSVATTDAPTGSPVPPAGGPTPPSTTPTLLPIPTTVATTSAPSVSAPTVTPTAGATTFSPSAGSTLVSSAGATSPAPTAGLTPTPTAGATTPTPSAAVTITPTIGAPVPTAGATTPAPSVAALTPIPTADVTTPAPSKATPTSKPASAAPVPAPTPAPSKATPTSQPASAAPVPAPTPAPSEATPTSQPASAAPVPAPTPTPSEATPTSQPASAAPVSATPSPEASTTTSSESEGTPGSPGTPPTPVPGKVECDPDAELEFVYTEEDGTDLALLTVTHASGDRSEAGCLTLTRIYEWLGTDPAGVAGTLLYTVDPETGVENPNYTDAPTGTWLLRTSIEITNGVTFAIKGSGVDGDCDELKFYSTTGMWYRIMGYGGNIDIESTLIRSWDTANDEEHVLGDAADGKTPRSYISCVSEIFDEDEKCTGAAQKDMGECRMDIVDSELGYLGYDETEAYGISWKVRGLCDDLSNLDSLFDSIRVYGDMSSSNIHHMWYGMYSYGHLGGVWTDNLMHNNHVYGFDPHDDSDYLTIEGNIVWNNGNHGIIASKRCDHLRVADNVVYNNDGSGIMLHKSCDDSVVQGNNCTGNFDAGVSLVETSRCSVKDNSFVDNRWGFRVILGSTDNVLEENVLVANRYSDIYAYYGADEEVPEVEPFTGINVNNIFRNNDVDNVVKTVVDIEDSDGTEISSNTFTGRDGHFVFARSTDTHVVDNSGDAASGESDDITDSCFTEDSDRLPSC